MSLSKLLVVGSYERASEGNVRSTLLVELKLLLSYSEAVMELFWVLQQVEVQYVLEEVFPSKHLMET